jgi:hypothetical protein
VPEGSFTFRLTPFRVAAIFVAVFVLDADLHATAGPIFIVVTPVVPLAIRAVATAPTQMNKAIDGDATLVQTLFREITASRGGAARK